MASAVVRFWVISIALSVGLSVFCRRYALALAPLFLLGILVGCSWAWRADDEDGQTDGGLERTADDGEPAGQMLSYRLFGVGMVSLVGPAGVFVLLYRQMSVFVLCSSLVHGRS